MKGPVRDNTPRAAKVGERTGAKCPLCDEPVLRPENTSGNGSGDGRLVCSKRGCPWRGTER